MKHTTLSLISFSDKPFLQVFEAELELHSIFWFHTLAQPRGKYVHVSLPLIHNYPLLLAFLGRPVEESYVAIANKITNSVKAEGVWERHGFYIYPAITLKAHVRTILFSMGGTGYITMKARTRASIPDLTSHQVFLPGTIFKTYLIARLRKPVLPDFIRLGAKRYGVFKVTYKHIGSAQVEDNVTKRATHLFNVKECPARTYYSIMSHYAGEIALSGIPEKVIAIRDIVLATPSFLFQPG